MKKRDIHYSVKERDSVFVCVRVLVYVCVREREREG